MIVYVHGGIPVMNINICFMKRIHYYKTTDGDIVGGLTLTAIKKRIRKEGGCGYTLHIDRYGSVQETTPISLNNNAALTYNAKYNNSRVYNQPQGKKDGIQINWDEILNNIIIECRAMNIAEDSHDEIFRLLKKYIPDASNLGEGSLSYILSHVHGALGHEYRGSRKYGLMDDAIRKFKADT